MNKVNQVIKKTVKGKNQLLHDHLEVGYVNIIGLRVLSVRVRELVFEKQLTTYKEVADELIQELIREGKMPTDAKNAVNFYICFRVRMKRM